MQMRAHEIVGSMRVGPGWRSSGHTGGPVIMFVIIFIVVSHPLEWARAQWGPGRARLGYIWSTLQ